MNAIEKFIIGIPKAELHVHIEGTLEPELKFRLAERNNIDLPYKNIGEMKLAYDFDDLSSFLKVYYEGMNVLIHEQDFYDLTYTYLETASSQNVLYSEIFFDPQAHMVRGVDFDTVINGLRKAQTQAKDDFGIQSQLIMCFLRDMSAESAMETLEKSLSYKEWIVGVGLDSDERGNPPIKFKDVFKKAKEEEFKVTIHCDVDQDDSIKHIGQCLNDIKVDRIDHGVNSLDDINLTDEIKERKLALTVCPISNKYVTDGLKAAEIKDMLELDIQVTVNSDDPAYFPGYMNENLIETQRAVNLSREQIVQLSYNAFTNAWISNSAKDEYLKILKDYGEK